MALCRLVVIDNGRFIMLAKSAKRPPMPREEKLFYDLKMAFC
jgi:hypothetical protein